MLTLRPATMDDAAFLFRLRCDPETVRQSQGPAPDNVEHMAWLAESLSNKKRRLYVMEEYLGCFPNPLGTGRLDYADGAVELSWTIAPEHRGHGYAEHLIRALITEAGRVWPRVSCVALIKRENISSLRAALSAGMMPSAPEMVRLETPTTTEAHHAH